MSAARRHGRALAARAAPGRARSRHGRPLRLRRARPRRLGGLSLAIGVRVLAGRLAIPTAGLLLVVAAVASDVVDRLATILTFEDVQRIATLALIVILFEGGSSIGLRRFRRAAVPIVALGVLGTFGTAALRRRRRALRARPLVDRLGADRRRARPDRSGGHVLRARRQGGGAAAPGRSSRASPASTTRSGSR